jgi:hypothetical protein
VDAELEQATPNIQAHRHTTPLARIASIWSAV